MLLRRGLVLNGLQEATLSEELRPFSQEQLALKEAPKAALNNEHDIEIQLDVNEARKGLKTELQRIIDLTTFALHACDLESGDLTSTPGALVSYGTSPSTMMTWAEAKEISRTWLVGAGLRDAVETASVFLEHINYFCVAINLEIEGKLSQWHDIMPKEKKSFHRLGLPDKLKKLSKYNPCLVHPLTKSLIQLNKARNCLVHRKGLVSELDVINNTLVISWLAMDIHQESCNQSSVSYNFRVKAVSDNDSEPLHDYSSQREPKPSGIRRVVKSKSFFLGETIVFTAQEFAEICYTLLIMANEIEKELLSHLKKKGVVIN